MQIVVIAKEPLPGRVKTRLCPPCTPNEAAAIAAAALSDTLATVAATVATRRVVALDGTAGPWIPDAFEVIDQRSGDLADRLHGAFEDCFEVSDEPVMLIGMDTPQVSVEVLAEAARAFDTGADAVIGLAPDGGYWLVALRHLHPQAFVGVPMSADDTGALQIERLRECGYRVALTQALRDVDDADDARAIAAQIPGSRFSAAVASAQLSEEQLATTAARVS